MVYYVNEEIQKCLQFSLFFLTIRGTCESGKGDFTIHTSTQNVKNEFSNMKILIIHITFIIWFTASIITIEERFLFLAEMTKKLKTT